ncbi:MAG TPA: putrescine aminotransferase [Lachnospiraceae bacterium]|jgi:spermidine/putrescine transport system permease protein|nr:putrescine aminotransferase [Lachnospiraceae bacterium]HCG59522.1 putrescine aminotransferase [Lachnospiraceae bacterium]
MKKTISRIYVIFVFILLYAPIAVLIAFSFNNSRTRAKWGGFTFKWYLQMFQDAEIMGALRNTLILALLSATIATILGLMASLSLNRMKRRNRTVMLSVLNIPMLNADIVTGISLMLIFIAFGQFLTHYGYTIVFGFGTVLVGHITFNIPYTVMSILPRVSAINPSTYEAALDLGASPSQAFRKVVFPDILPGILSGFLLAFTLSLDDFVITHFVKGPGFDTLSTKIYTEVRKGIKPEMYALSTLLFLGVLLLLIVVEKGKGARNKNRKPAY